MTESEPRDEYAGPATIRTDGAELGVRVLLRGAFEPIDGRFHWYGRIDVDEAVGALGSGAEVVLETDRGAATGRLSDVDPWGRYRVSGTGRPPF